MRRPYVAALAAEGALFGRCPRRRLFQREVGVGRAAAPRDHRLAEPAKMPHLFARDLLDLGGEVALADAVGVLEVLHDRGVLAAEVVLEQGDDARWIADLDHEPLALGLKLRVHR